MKHNKVERAVAAQKWINTLRGPLKIRDTFDALGGTRYVQHYTPKRFSNLYSDTKISIMDLSVVECLVHKSWDKDESTRSCILCFASYTNPGGGFLKGAVSQEEDICRYSNLYPCLNFYRDVYRARKQCKSTGIYGDDFFYVRGAKFYVNGESITSDILVMSAPNKYKVKGDVDAALKRRMEIAYNYPRSQGVTHLYLGAFGCGLFGNDPKLVAEYWKELYEESPGYYREIIHPVPNKSVATIFKGVLDVEYFLR